MPSVKNELDNIAATWEIIFGNGRFDVKLLQLTLRPNYIKCLVYSKGRIFRHGLFGGTVLGIKFFFENWLKYFWCSLFFTKWILIMMLYSNFDFTYWFNHKTGFNLQSSQRWNIFSALNIFSIHFVKNNEHQKYFNQFSKFFWYLMYLY